MTTAEANNDNATTNHPSRAEIDGTAPRDIHPLEVKP